LAYQPIVKSRITIDLINSIPNSKEHGEHKIYIELLSEDAQS